MKKHLCILFITLLSFASFATPPNYAYFSSESLPSQPGQFPCSYFSTNSPNVADYLTLATNTTGPLPFQPGPSWDFSQLQQPNESVLRTDILAPGDAMNGDQF